LGRVGARVSQGLVRDQLGYGGALYSGDFMGLKERLLSADDLPLEKVSVPEWAEALAGEELYVRTITGLERDRFEAAIVVGGKIQKDNLRARLIALAVVDKERKPVFDEADVPALGKKSAVALERMASVAMRLGGFNERELEKNSETTPPAASPSA
jgi:hypothetical protein